MHSFILYTALHYETLYHHAYVWHNYIVCTYTHKHVHYTYMYMHAYTHIYDWHGAAKGTKLAQNIHYNKMINILSSVYNILLL